MQLSHNTIFITGGGSGIGRGLAEALHKLGNKVIISGRRQEQLDAVAIKNPGIDTVALDISDPSSIADVAATLISRYPTLNVLINNAGIMLFDDSGAPMDSENVTREIETNLLGPIRMTSALVAHLKAQPAAWILYNSSVLAFTPLAMFAVYCATKAALHSYAMSQRFMLRDSSVRVQEIAPPWVGTGLVGEVNDPRAVPLEKFIQDTIDILSTGAEEILVEEAIPLRNNAGPNEYVFFNQFNADMVANFAGSEE